MPATHGCILSQPWMCGIRDPMASLSTRPLVTQLPNVQLLPGGSRGPIAEGFLLQSQQMCFRYHMAYLPSTAVAAGGRVHRQRLQEALLMCG